MSDSYVKADFSGLDKILKNLDPNMFVDVGVLEGGSYPEGGKTIAYIGAVHEFGTDKAGRGKDTVIQQRSFIKMPIEKKSKEITKDVEKTFELNFGNGNIEQIFMTIGVACEIQIQNAFETGGFGKWPELAESTIDAKGSSAILIHRSFLRKSISWKVGKR